MESVLCCCTECSNCSTLVRFPQKSHFVVVWQNVIKTLTYRFRSYWMTFLMYHVVLPKNSKPHVIITYYRVRRANEINETVWFRDIRCSPWNSRSYGDSRFRKLRAHRLVERPCGLKSRSNGRVVVFFSRHVRRRVYRSREFCARARVRYRR